MRINRKKKEKSQGKKKLAIFFVGNKKLAFDLRLRYTDTDTLRSSDSDSDTDSDSLQLLGCRVSERYALHLSDTDARKKRHILHKSIDILQHISVFLFFFCKQATNESPPFWWATRHSLTPQRPSCHKRTPECGGWWRVGVLIYCQLDSKSPRRVVEKI